jgi:hypothetical protein
MCIIATADSRIRSNQVHRNVVRTISNEFAQKNLSYLRNRRAGCVIYSHFLSFIHENLDN